MSNIEISFVCPITKHAGDVAAVHREFRDVIARTGRRAEFIYVLDGLCTGAEESIAAIDEDHFPVRVFRMAKGFGESTALQFGFEQARGSFILTIADPSLRSSKIKQANPVRRPTTPPTAFNTRTGHGSGFPRLGSGSKRLMERSDCSRSLGTLPVRCRRKKSDSSSRGRCRRLSGSRASG